MCCSACHADYLIVCDLILLQQLATHFVVQLSVTLPSKIYTSRTKLRTSSLDKRQQSNWVEMATNIIPDRMRREQTLSGMWTLNQLAIAAGSVFCVLIPFTISTTVELTSRVQFSTNGSYYGRYCVTQFICSDFVSLGNYYLTLSIDPVGCWKWYHNHCQSVREISRNRDELKMLFVGLIVVTCSITVPLRFWGLINPTAGGFSWYC